MECVEHIGREGRRVRIFLGFVMVAITAIAFGVMAIESLGPVWRTLLVLPVFGSVLSFLQVREQTCVFLYLRGLEDHGEGPQPMNDATRLLVRKQVRRVILQSLVLTAILGTGLAVVPV